MGNKAVIKAGRAPGLENGTYGTVNITAGGNFTICKSATIYADDLNIETTTSDITFCDNADLLGVTDGESIKAQQGSIHMGENLVVHSNAEATEFVAQSGDIVIDAQGFVDVRDNAYVHTYFGGSSSENNRTEISGDKGVSFGDNARFDTTVLTLNAGDSVSASAGNLT